MEENSGKQITCTFENIEGSMLRSTVVRKSRLHTNQRAREFEITEFELTTVYLARECFKILPKLL